MLNRLLTRRTAVGCLRPRLPIRRLHPPSAHVNPRHFATTASSSQPEPTQPAATPTSQRSSTPPSFVPDLSYESAPIGALYPLFTPTRDTFSPFLLTPDQLTFYTTNGYLSNLPCLTIDQCDALLAHYQQFLQWDNNQQHHNSPTNHRHHAGLDLFHEFHTNQTGDPSNVLCHALGQWRVSPLFHDLVFHPALVVRVAQCMAACFTPIPNCSVRPVVPHASTGAVLPVSFWHDQLFAKPAKHGGNVAWHQVNTVHPISPLTSWSTATCAAIRC